MSDASENIDRRPPTVFLSYASEDRAAARRIGDALPGYGLEVWYDESELGGGDAWDQKIRKQIRDCDYFMALVSAQTEARPEGYFRREWRFAVERTLDMADDHTFLLPIVIDDTTQAGARVPEKFLAVQWLRVPGGEPTPALEAMCRRLASGVTADPTPGKAIKARPVKATSRRPAAVYPDFPKEEPGQRTRFLFRVLGWGLRSGGVFFSQLPKWLRIMAYIWLAAILFSKGCSSPSKHRQSAELSPAEAQKLKAIADAYKGSTNRGDIAKLGVSIAREFADEAASEGTRSPLLAIPFTAGPGDEAGEKLADATFAQVFGRISVSHGKQVGLALDPLSPRSLAAAVDRARANHSIYVLWGSVDGAGTAEALNVKIAAVEDGSVEWSKSYPVAGADPVKIATDVDSHIPALDDD